MCIYSEPAYTSAMNVVKLDCRHLLYKKHGTAVFFTCKARNCHFLISAMPTLSVLFFLLYPLLFFYFTDQPHSTGIPLTEKSSSPVGECFYGLCVHKCENRTCSY
jgi:hypothetical protein